MTVIHRTAIMPYTPAQMFALVDDIDHYPEFLPWCSATKIKERTATTVLASIEIHKMGLRKKFTTRNHNEAPHKITMEFVNGPFKYLNGMWQFLEIDGDNGCKIMLDIDYQLVGGILDKAFGAVFNTIANSMVDAFCQRAKHIYDSELH